MTTQSQDIFKAFGSNWKWASLSNAGSARVHTELPVITNGVVCYKLGTSAHSRCEAFDQDLTDGVPSIWERTDFSNGPQYPTDCFGLAFPAPTVSELPVYRHESWCPEKCAASVCSCWQVPVVPQMPTQAAPAPAPMAPPVATRLTTEEAENGGLWKFARNDEQYVRVNLTGDVVFGTLNAAGMGRLAYDVVVDGVTHPIERTRSQQVSPPEAGVPYVDKFDAQPAPALSVPNTPTPAAAPVPNPFAVVLPFIRHAERYRLVGSRVTCNPPPLDTDQDVLVEVHACNRIAMEDQMRQEGYVFEGSAPTDVTAERGDVMDPQRVFTSMRKGSMNYILTSDPDFYQRFTAATELAKKFNVLLKADRIALFQGVLYGNVV